MIPIIFLVIFAAFIWAVVVRAVGKSNRPALRGCVNYFLGGMLVLVVGLIAAYTYDSYSAGVYEYVDAAHSPLDGVIPASSVNIVYYQKAPFYPIGGYAFHCSHEDFVSWAKAAMQKYPERTFIERRGPSEPFVPSAEADKMQLLKIEDAHVFGSLIEDRTVFYGYDLKAGIAYFYYTTR